MPYINTTVSTALSESQKTALKEKYGKAIEILPGKSEAYLMLNFTDNASMYFGGSNAKPAAMVEVNVFGTLSADECDSLTAKICSIINDETAIEKGRIYVKY